MDFFQIHFYSHLVRSLERIVVSLTVLCQRARLVAKEILDST